MDIQIILSKTWHFFVGIDDIILKFILTSEGTRIDRTNLKNKMGN